MDLAEWQEKQGHHGHGSQLWMNGKNMERSFQRIKHPETQR